MNKPLRVLIVEDSKKDTSLLLNELYRTGFSPIYERVDTGETLNSALHRKTWDVVICNYRGLWFDALSALSLLQDNHMDLPFIVVTDLASEDIEEEALKSGAHGFLRKDNLARLAPIIARELLNKKKYKEKSREEIVLSNSVKKFRFIFYNSLDIIMILDGKSGEILDVNHAAQRILGYDCESLVGHNFSILFSPESTQYRNRFMENLYAAGSFFDSQKFRRADGSICVLDLAACIIPSNDRKEILVILRNVPDHKYFSYGTLAENIERYHPMLDSSPDPVMVCNTEGGIIYCNPTFTQVFGWNLVEILDKNIHSDFPEENQNETDMIIDMIRSGERFSNTESCRYTKGKNIIFVSTSGSPIHGQNGKPVGSIITFRDIRKKKMIEDQLRQAQKMEAIGLLAGGITHDFNNILTPIIGFTEMAMEDISENSLARKNLEEVLEAAKRARKLVQQILYLCRKQDQQKEPIRIQPILTEALSLLRATLPSTIEIRYKTDDTFATVKADPTQIHQVIMNLCTNAYQAMREKGGILEIDLKEIEIGFGGLSPNPKLNPGKYMKLSISDTGHGVDPELIENIFDPYFSTKDNGEGTGLGLCVVDGIVRSHGGHIKSQSKPGIGTSFNVFLPVFDKNSGASEIEPSESL